MLLLVVVVVVLVVVGVVVGAGGGETGGRRRREGYVARARGDPVPMDPVPMDRREGYVARAGGECTRHADRRLDRRRLPSMVHGSRVQRPRHADRWLDRRRLPSLRPPLCWLRVGWTLYPWTLGVPSARRVRRRRREAPSLAHLCICMKGTHAHVKGAHADVEGDCVS